MQIYKDKNGAIVIDFEGATVTAPEGTSQTFGCVPEFDEPQITFTNAVVDGFLVGAEIGSEPVQNGRL